MKKERKKERKTIPAFSTPAHTPFLLPFPLPFAYIYIPPIFNHYLHCQPSSPYRERKPNTCSKSGFFSIPKCHDPLLSQNINTTSSTFSTSYNSLTVSLFSSCWCSGEIKIGAIKMKIVGMKFYTTFYLNFLSHDPTWWY